MVLSVAQVDNPWVAPAGCAEALNAVWLAFERCIYTLSMSVQRGYGWHRDTGLGTVSFYKQRSTIQLALTIGLW